MPLFRRCYAMLSRLPRDMSLRHIAAYADAAGCHMQNYCRCHYAAAASHCYFAATCRCMLLPDTFYDTIFHTMLPC